MNFTSRGSLITPSAGSTNEFLFASACKSWICFCSFATSSALPLTQKRPAPRVNTTITPTTSAAMPQPMAIFAPVPK